jgi:hypothetical protein
MAGRQLNGFFKYSPSLSIINFKSWRWKSVDIFIVFYKNRHQNCLIRFED